MQKYLCAASLLATTLALPGVAAAQNATPSPPASGTPTTAPATTAVEAPAVGAKVFDADGGEVGTVESVQGDIVTINTGTARAGLPLRAFAMREKGPTIAMTRAQLEAAAMGANAQTQASKDAALVAGATINGSDGASIGTISQIEGENVTVLLADGSSAIIRKADLGLVNGALTIGLTAQAFVAQVHAATGKKP